MAKQLKLRRGTTSQHGSFTGAEGEVTVDTDKETLVVHDGSTAGGHPVAAEDLANVSSANIVGRLGTGSIVKAKLEADIIDGTKLADDAVNSEHYVDASIDHQHLSNDCIDGDNIQDDVVNSEHIAAGAIDLEHMSSESVDEDNLKISNSGTNGQFLSKQTGNNGGLTWADVDLTPYAPLASPALTGTATGVNLTLSGNLTVNGTTTTVASTNTTITDNLLELNSGASSNANDSGILIERGSTGDNAIIAWDESADKFTVGTTTGTASSTGNISITTGTLVANVEGNLSGNGSGITNIPAANLTGTLPSINGGNLTVLTASSLTGSMPAIPAGNLTDLNATNLGSGTVPTARLGSGTADSSKVLRGNGTWGAPETIQTTTTTANSTYYIPFAPAWGSGGSILYGDSGNSLTYNPSTNVLTSGSFSGSGASLTSLNASNLGSGTIPSSRFPSTLPAVSGANLTNLPPSGGSFTATASGALSAGDPVVMKTNGQVEKVTRSVTMESDPDVSAGVTTDMWPEANSDQSKCKTVYIPAQNKIVAVWMRFRQSQSSGNDDIFINSGTVADNGDVTWDNNGGNAIQTVGNSGARNSYPNVIYDDVNDRIIVGYRRNNGSGNKPYTVVITPDWAGGTWPTTGGSEQEAVSTGDYRMLIHDKQYNRYVIYYDNSGHKCKIGEMNANKNGITWGAEQSLTSDSVSYVTYFWHPRDGSNGRHYIVYTSNPSPYAFKYLVHNINGTNKTTSVTGTSTMLSSGYNYVWGESGGGNATWTTGTNYLCGVIVTPQHGTQTMRLRVGYCNTTSISFTDTQWATHDSGTSGAAGTYAYNQVFNIYWDSISERLVTTKFRRNGSNAYWNDFQMWTISGNTPSLSGSQYSNYESVQPDSWGGLATYIEAKNYALLYRTGVNYSNGYRYRVARKITNSTFTTNLLATNFAGFSSAGYSNGNTATIHVVGKVNENQTGLTTGSTYYVKDNGVLSTTAGNPSVSVGLAIASTKLLIR